MAERKLKFKDGEYYHIYNRGIEKRNIFLDWQDVQYFIDRIQDFNTIEIFGGVRNMKLKGNYKRVLKAQTKNVVEIIAYAVNPNHFHLVLKQVRSDGESMHDGISAFMQRVFTGYVNYFNKKYKRQGPLFQGKFKAAQIHNKVALKEIVAYVNLNYKVHKINSKYIIKTSFLEYSDKKQKQICWKKDVMEQFKTLKEFIQYSKEEIKKIIKERDFLKSNNFEEDHCF